MVPRRFRVVTADGFGMALACFPWFRGGSRLFWLDFVGVLGGSWRILGSCWWLHLVLGWSCANLGLL